MSENNLGQITVDVTAEGTEEAAEEAAEATAPDDGPAPDGPAPPDDGDGADAIVAPLAKKLGPLAIIAGVLLALEPIQAMLSTILDIVGSLLAPFLILMLRLVGPVLQLLMELLPFLIDFAKDPLGFYIEALKWLWGNMSNVLMGIWAATKALPGLLWDAFLAVVDWAGDIGGAIWEAIKSGAGWLAKGLSDIASQIADAIKGVLSFAAASVSDVVSQIADAISGALPGGGVLDSVPGLATGGVVREETLARVGEAGPEAVIPLDRLESILDRGQGPTQIQFRGGLSTFIESVESDDTVDLL